MPVTDGKVEQYIAKVDELKSQVVELESEVRQLGHSVDRVEDKRQADHDLLIEVKQLVQAMPDAIRDSVSAVHKRVDEIQTENTREAGRAEGRKEQRVAMFKWISGIVGLIAIVGYLGRTEAETTHPTIKQEAVTHERRHNDS